MAYPSPYMDPRMDHNHNNRECRESGQHYTTRGKGANDFRKFLFLKYLYIKRLKKNLSAPFKAYKIRVKRGKLGTLTL